MSRRNNSVKQGWRGLGGNWRKRPPSPKQEDYLIIHKLPVPETAGEANDVIYKHWMEQQGKDPKDRT